MDSKTSEHSDLLSQEVLNEISAETARMHAILASMKRAGEPADSEVVQEMAERLYTYFQGLDDAFDLAAYKELALAYPTQEAFSTYFEGFDTGMAQWLSDATLLFVSQHS